MRLRQGSSARFGPRVGLLLFRLLSTGFSTSIAPWLCSYGPRQEPLKERLEVLDGLCQVVGEIVLGRGVMHTLHSTSLDGLLENGQARV